MARKQRAKPPTTEPTQWRHLDPEGRTALTASMKQHGRVKERIGASIEKEQTAAATETNKPYLRKKAEISAKKLSEFEGQVTNAPITVSGAAVRRVGEVERAVTRSRETGTGLRGAGWYFEHHQSIKDVAAQHGFDVPTAITASASMSPQNAPTNERAAVTEMMRAHAEGHEVVPKIHAAAKAVGGVRGKPRSIREMTGEQVGALSRAATQHQFETPHGTGLKQIGRGGTEISKGWDVLTGRTEAASAINPQTSPKVWSYEKAIQSAVPGSAEHGEYMTRADMLQRNLGATHQQEAMDLWGKRSSREGILDPAGHTAEDTWMNTITMGQGMGDVPVTGGGGRTVLGKTIASHKKLGLAPATRVETPSGTKSVMPGIKPESAMHAFNNQATIHAAATLTERTGGFAEVPAVMAQETAWTETRTRTGKDPEYKAEQKLNASQFGKSPKPHPTLF